MSQKLFEANFITINTSAWDRPISASSTKQKEQPDENSADKSQTAEVTTKEVANEGYPSAGKFLEWGKWLDKRLKENAELSQEARQPEKEILDEFFENFFKVNWPNYGEKLYTLTRIREFFIKDNRPIVNNFDIASSSFLKYLTKNADKLTKENYTGILVAYGKRYISRTELARDAVADEYNLIHCPLLYKLPSDNILKYLELQSLILPYASNKYDTVIQELNKKVFLYNSKITEQDPEERAVKIKSTDAPEMSSTTKLNDLELARQIVGAKKSQPNALTNKEQNEIIKKLGDNINTKYAALVLLSTQFEQNAEVAKALVDAKFASVDKTQAGATLLELIRKKTIPVGTLNKTTVDSLAKAIIDSIS